MSMPAHTRLQISVWSSYDLCHPGWNPDRHTQTACHQLICWAKN